MLATTTFLVTAWATGAEAGERFVHVPLSALQFEGEGPKLPLREDVFAYSMWRVSRATTVYAVLEGDGEVYLDTGTTSTNPWEDRYASLSGIAMRVDDGAPIQGRLFVTDGEAKAVHAYRFALTAPPEDAGARTRFLRAKARHYESLLQDGNPGAGWFRHQRDDARKQLEEATNTTDPTRNRREPADPLELFSGARAVAENLDLDRGLRVATETEATIDVNGIEGVTTRAFDWKSMVKDLRPELDPLARFVPADQYAVFFPSFEALTRVVDDLDESGGGLLEYFQARVEDQLTKERYQRQLCLPLSALGRLLGPTVVSSVAMTGSDPFLPTGADLVIVFDCKLPDVLEKFLALRRSEAEKGGAEHLSGKILDLPFEGTVSADRSVCCYSVRLDSAVIVSNSIPSLVHVVQTSRDATQSLLSADEYVWFRDRYRRGQDGESACIVLTDATIRRLAGPRSRIAESRRTRAAAAMTEITARHVDEVVRGKIPIGTKASDPDFPISEDFVWDARGVYSQRYGSLRFLTPLCELGVEKVSPQERDAYDQYRRSFQSRWSDYFDPICVRLAFDGQHLRADATILPLTLGTEYREIRELTGDGTLPPQAGDPHDGALFHFASAFSKSSELGRMLSQATGPMSSRFGPDPLAWLGASMAIWGERDAWWDDIVEQGGIDRAEDLDWYRIPLVLQLDVVDPLKLAGFVTALRALADESAPNLVKWENRTWHDVTYVCITPEESLGLDEPGREPHLFYATLPDAFLITLREDLLQAAIDRRKARKEGTPIEGGDRSWIGKSAGLRFESEGIGVLLSSFDGRSERLAEAAWSTIPILDEWSRRFPSENPVVVHERLFGVRLTTPTGTPLVWNADIQSMESPEYGRPGLRKPAADMRRHFRGIARAECGLEFERDGLRVKVEIEKARSK